MTLKKSTSQKLSPYIIFTDGASSGNPGPGGWAFIRISPEHHVLEQGGHDPQTTNNAMELTATLQALESIPNDDDHPAPVELYTDSTYVILGITKWVHGWKKRSWLTTQGTEIANLELWQKLLRVSSKREVHWNYVRGHSGVVGNERADEIAVAFSQRVKPSLFHGNLKNYPYSILDLPKDTNLPASALSFNQKTEIKPTSYLSLVSGVLKKHANWRDCEAWVKGKSGAKFKKAMNEREEREILKAWGFDPIHLPKIDS